MFSFLSSGASLSLFRPDPSCISSKTLPTSYSIPHTSTQGGKCLPVPSVLPISDHGEVSEGPSCLSAVRSGSSRSKARLQNDLIQTPTKAARRDEAPDLSQLLGSMISLIVAQGKAIKASEQRDLAFKSTMDKKLNLLEGRIYTLRAAIDYLPSNSGLNDRLQHVSKKLRAVEDAFQEHPRAPDSRPQRSFVRSAKHVQQPLTRPTLDDDLPLKEQAQIHDADRNPNSPSIQLSVTPSDTERRSEVAIAHAREDPARSTFRNGVELSLVDRAIQAEEERLGGATVLAEGESTVEFHVRKRVVKKRKRNDFRLDMGFLDEVSIDENAVVQNNDPYEAYMNASQLSSGIEDLPESIRSRASSVDPGSTSQSQGRSRRNARESNPWNPFPTQMMRQRSISISPSTSSANSEDSHLTAVRRGASLVEDQLLAPGRPREWDKRGKRRKNGRPRKRGPKWPAFGPNTVKTRMEEVVCDNCSGRVHYACAGPLRGKDMNKEPWSCPNCVWILSHADDDEEIDIPQAQQERCLREDCIYRSAKKIVRKNDDDNEFFMERIVGRKRLRWETNGDATYVYLVKWYDWALYDSTWEPRSNIPNIARQEALFLQEAKRQGLLDPRQKVILLPEVELWFDHKGQYRIDVLLELGVNRRWWWEN
ncbi:hypothetical protein IAU59_005843 [Kwoniella sp. CBS 9459]